MSKLSARNRRLTAPHSAHKLSGEWSGEKKTRTHTNTFLFRYNLLVWVNFFSLVGCSIHLCCCCDGKQCMRQCTEMSLFKSTIILAFECVKELYSWAKSTRRAILFDSRHTESAVNFDNDEIDESQEKNGASNAASEVHNFVVIYLYWIECIWCVFV